MKWAKRIAGTAVLVALVVAGLFVWNGVSSEWRTPEFGVAGPLPEEDAPSEVRVLAFNLAKLGFHRGGTEFLGRVEVEERVSAVAALVKESRADLVFLSEIVWEGGPNPVNQVMRLAEESGMHAYAYGDNYRFGLPFFRVRSGNAILSKYPLEPVEVTQLLGATPFYSPTGNRRLLWCDVEIGAKTLRIGSVRNDSFDLENNAKQVDQILAQLGTDNVESVLLAGDFNAELEDPSMQALESSGRFLAIEPGAPTFPTHAPNRRIDFILAPASWTRMESRNLESDLSDHLPVFASFRLDASD